MLLVVYSFGPPTYPRFAPPRRFILTYSLRSLPAQSIFHKGVVQGFEDGDFGALLGAGAFGVCVVALTGWLALKGDESDILY